MNDLDPQEIQKRVNNLAPALQELLSSEEMAQKCDMLADKYLLTPEQKDILLEEVARVVLKYTPLTRLRDRLSQQLRVPRALALAAEIDKEILSPVHYLLVPQQAQPTTPSTTPTTSPQQTVATPSQPNTSLAEQVAQFQARKKQREEELKQITPGQTASPQVSTPPTQPQPNLPQ